MITTAHFAKEGTMHAHRATNTVEQGYDGCRIPSGSPQHQAAHGGVIQYQTCRCGATRVVEINGGNRVTDDWYNDEGGDR